MTTSTVILPRDAIEVGERVRDDYGDIDSLARSLAKWGMLFPVLVDQRYVLCDGGRRLRAAEAAGLDLIPVTVRQMTEDERRELELEVDIEHKQLTDLERNKRLVARAAEAAAAMRAKAEIDASRASISRGPKPKDGVKVSDQAAALGVSERKLVDARAHVKAVEQFSDLEGLPQEEATRLARKRRMQSTPGAVERELDREARESQTRIARQFSTRLPHLHELTRLDPASLAGALTPEHWRHFDEVEANAMRWFAEVRRARSGGMTLVS
jgi:ParB-like chromosome segregation protein Spo0J